MFLNSLNRSHSRYIFINRRIDKPRSCKRLCEACGLMAVVLNWRWNYYNNAIEKCVCCTNIKRRREKITFFTLASIDSQSELLLDWIESNRWRKGSENKSKFNPSVRGGKWNVHKLLTLWSARSETLLAREAFREMKQSAKGAQSRRQWLFARLIQSLFPKRVVNRWETATKASQRAGTLSAFVNHVRIFKGLLAGCCVSLFLLAFIFAIEENKNLPTHTGSNKKPNTSDFYEWNYHKAEINGRLAGRMQWLKIIKKNCCKTKSKTKKKRAAKTTAMNQRTWWSMEADKATEA